MWTSESTGTDPKTGELTFTICCNHGQIKLPPINQPPTLLDELLHSRWFRNTIRVYNSVLAFTSVGKKMDYGVVHAPGPYTIQIQGQTHHRIGSLIPQQGRLPEYLQLYIFDTSNEVRNRLNAMGQTSTEGNLDETTLTRLIEMIDENNCLAKFFRRARDYYESNGKEFTIRLLPDKGKGKEYDLPSTSEVACLIIRDDHPLYMSLQYPLLFPYGEYGFHPDILLHLETSTSRTRQFLTLRQFYAAQIQTRLNQGMTLIKGGRLLHQFVVDGDTDAKIIGQRFILPPSFTGGPRYLVEKYHDAMAICRVYGNPNLFITMTENPNWREIKEHLEKYGGDSPNDRPDVECRVFKMKTSSAEEMDEIITAKLPNKEEDPEAYNLVIKHMIHGPCGDANRKSPCMEKTVCTKKYPQPYNENTSIDKSGYVLYRRRRNDDASVVKDGAFLNNNFVVPHSIKLLKKYEAHINVEWCNRTSAVKYLFKYITKGVDRASAVIEKGYTATASDAVASSEPKDKVIKQQNEIQEFIDARYLSACESMWRTFAFHIHKRKPSVEKLIIHLEGEHNITVKETDNLGRVIRKPGIEKTMFIEWMIKGPRSYDELKTFKDVKYPDFKSVCHARGYLDNDVEWHESMSEAARSATPFQLRDMFLTFLNNCFVTSPKKLWEHSWKSMSEDILYKR
ncbi:unnamed protein product [Brassica oleracea var. botrytis]|uniref:Helitron helicase-like domain-containing protein n=1 Tax=Brassica oleracea TaxID=3712 RepID=A0A3P6B631_BRAOL|nr:unnamed protein product [Brassica oleracea]